MNEQFTGYAEIAYLLLNFVYIGGRRIAKVVGAVKRTVMEQCLNNVSL